MKLHYSLFILLFWAQIVVAQEPQGNASQALADIVTLSNQSNEKCISYVNYSGKFESCEAKLVAKNQAILFQIVTECGGDSCSALAWLFFSSQTSVKIPEEITGGTLEYIPSLNAIVGDEVNLKDPQKLGSWQITLSYFDLKTKQLTHKWADCMSPVLSPEGKWLVCRSKNGDVQKISLAGTSLQTIAKSPVQNVDFVPYSYIYPGPVRFISSNKIQFETLKKNESQAVIKTIRWQE